MDFACRPTPPPTGVVGTNLPKADDQNYIFNFHPLTEEEIDQALVMKKFSQELAKREEDEVKTFLADSKIKLDYESLMAKEELKRKGATIALLIPVTSKGNDDGWNTLLYC